VKKNLNLSSSKILNKQRELIAQANNLLKMNYNMIKKIKMSKIIRLKYKIILRKIKPTMIFKLNNKNYLINLILK
jgi:phospholipid N-methyltransferase